MQNSIWLYRLYDIAEEFNLTTVENTLAKEKPTSRRGLTRVKPKSIVIENPPVAVDLGAVLIPLGQKELNGHLTAKVYGLGVVSLILRIALPEKIEYDDLRELAVDLYNFDKIETIFEKNLLYIREVLTGTYVPTVKTNFVEDFTLYFFRNWNKDWDPVPILLAEKEELSKQTTEETLKNSFSYGKRDMSIITWDAALIYDEDGSTDIPELLEFALTQLLELRYYDGLLSEEMNIMYSHIEEANSFSWYPRLASYRRISNNLMAMVADVTEITERVQNFIKVTEDIFYARVYAAALAIFRTQSWNNSIQHKISVIQRTYEMLSSEIENSRATFLEATIIFLIALEIVLGLLKMF